MTTLRHLSTVLVLLGACLLSMASLGLIFDGSEQDDPSASVSFTDNSSLSGCYTQEGGSQINSYWFDGSGSCSHDMWNSLSGSVSYSCTYSVSDGRVDLSYSDGSSESFALGSADNGITLDGDLYSYSGQSCG